MAGTVSDELVRLAQDGADAMMHMRQALQRVGVIEDLGPDVGGPIETALRKYGTNPSALSPTVVRDLTPAPARAARARGARRRRSEHELYEEECEIYEVLGVR